MQVLTPGHKYIADNYEDSSTGQTIQFIEKAQKLEGGSLGELYIVNDGTTNEELIDVLVDRLNYLNAKFPCRENAIAIAHLETAKLWLEKRTADRQKRGVKGQAVK